MHTALVTGANGHLGNNLVRNLVRYGAHVRAGIRDPRWHGPLSALGCETVSLDLLDPPTISEALDGVDVLYQVGAVFRHWSPDPEREIYQANLRATENVLRAAARARVRKVVYVSSLAAADRSRVPITETGWNQETSNVYFRSKTDSEKLAWELAGGLGLDMVAVLPGAMIGRNCFIPTPTMSLFSAILDNRLSALPPFYFNFVDVEDVAAGCQAAAEHGLAGERYLLANEACTGLREIVVTAQALFPERKIKMPPSPPRPVLELVSRLMEGVARITRKEPTLQHNYLRAFTVKEYCDITKARRALGFDPAPPQAAIEKTLHAVISTDIPQETRTTALQVHGKSG